MKQVIYPLILIISFSLNLKAQHVSADISIGVKPEVKLISTDTTVRNADEDTSIVRMGEKDVQVIKHDGKTEIHWGKNAHRKHNNSKFDGHWEGIELGFNSFDKPDYSMYDVSDKDFMSLNQGKSLEFDLNFCELNIGLAKSYIGLVSGMGLSFNSYRFENPYTLVRDQELTKPMPLDPTTLSKTKLAVSYLRVPFMLEFQVPVNQHEGRLFVDAGVIGGVKIGSHTKVKQDDEKHKNHNGFNLNSFKYELTGRIGYKDISLFANYSLTPLFESGKGPGLTPFTIGISFSD